METPKIPRALQDLGRRRHGTLPPVLPTMGARLKTAAEGPRERSEVYSEDWAFLAPYFKREDRKIEESDYSSGGHLDREGSDRPNFPVLENLFNKKKLSRVLIDWVNKKIIKLYEHQSAPNYPPVNKSTSSSVCFQNLVANEIKKHIKKNFIVNLKKCTTD